MDVNEQCRRFDARLAALEARLDALEAEEEAYEILGEIPVQCDVDDEGDAGGLGLDFPECSTTYTE